MIKAAAIIQMVCDHFEVEEKALISKYRTDELVAPRHVAMFLLYKWAGYPNSTIGKLFNRDHTTVLHAKTRMKAVLYTHQPPYRDLIALDLRCEQEMSNQVA